MSVTCSPSKIDYAQCLRLSCTTPRKPKVESPARSETKVRKFLSFTEQINSTPTTNNKLAKKSIKYPMSEPPRQPRPLKRQPKLFFNSPKKESVYVIKDLLSPEAVPLSPTFPVEKLRFSTAENFEEISTPEAEVTSLDFSTNAEEKKYENIDNMISGLKNSHTVRDEELVILKKDIASLQKTIYELTNSLNKSSYTIFSNA